MSYPFHNLTDILSHVHCTLLLCIEQYFFKMKGHGCQHFVFISDLFSLPTLSYFPFPPVFVVIIILLTLISPNPVFQFPLLSLLFSSRVSPSLFTLSLLVSIILSHSHPSLSLTSPPNTFLILRSFYHNSLILVFQLPLSFSLDSTLSHSVLSHFPVLSCSFSSLSPLHHSHIFPFFYYPQAFLFQIKPYFLFSFSLSAIAHLHHVQFLSVSLHSLCPI